MLTEQLVGVLEGNDELHHHDVPVRQSMDTKDPHHT